MDNKLSRLKQFNWYDNIIITDKNGVCIYYDYSDAKVLELLELDLSEMVGQNVISAYKQLTNNNSTILQVISSGKPICNNEQILITKSGKEIKAINSTYPIIEKDNIIGAIEFSKYIYERSNTVIPEQSVHHEIYRNNNTYFSAKNIITKNKKMLQIKDKLSKIARTDSSILIYGKTGTGKEVISESIHNLSDRSSKPFISQNCAAIPSTLLESILFGTVKGSFTGATDSKGLFEQAEGGTLFLDEINSMSMDMQVKLLKAIEEKSIRRVGGNKRIPLDIRIIAATNENPDILINDGRMREDLYYRLAVVELKLPNLSERKEDIKELVYYYVNFYNEKMNIKITSIDDDVWDCFYNYNWPGNLRELRNAVETVYNNTDNEIMTVDDLPERIVRFCKEKHEVISGDDSLYQAEHIGLKQSVEKYEKHIIEDEMKITDGNLTKAAKKLGVSKQLLKYKVDKYMLLEDE